MPYSTAVHTPLSNFEAKLQYEVNRDEKDLNFYFFLNYYFFERMWKIQLWLWHFLWLMSLMCRWWHGLQHHGIVNNNGFFLFFCFFCFFFSFKRIHCATPSLNDSCRRSLGFGDFPCFFHLFLIIFNSNQYIFFFFVFH